MTDHIVPAESMTVTRLFSNNATSANVISKWKFRPAVLISVDQNAAFVTDSSIVRVCQGDLYVIQVLNEHSLFVALRLPCAFSFVL